MVNAYIHTLAFMNGNAKYFSNRNSILSTIVGRNVYDAMKMCATFLGFFNTISWHFRTIVQTTIVISIKSYEINEAT